MRRVINRGWRFLLTVASVLVLVLAPITDVAAFGLHEHTVGAPQSGNDLEGSDSRQGSTLSHHCEVSMSLGEMLPVVELPMPLLTIIDLREPHASSPQHRPLVPLTPPRA